MAHSVIPEQMRFPAKLLPEGKWAILEELHRGRRQGTITPDAPITGRRLARCLGGLSTDVHVRELVNALRREGHPIDSSRRGYFYALSKVELADTVNNLNSRVSAIVAAVEGMVSSFRGVSA